MNRREFSALLGTGFIFPQKLWGALKNAKNETPKLLVEHSVLPPKPGEYFNFPLVCIGTFQNPVSDGQVNAYRYLARLHWDKHRRILPFEGGMVVYELESPGFSLRAKGVSMSYRNATIINVMLSVWHHTGGLMVCNQEIRAFRRPSVDAMPCDAVPDQDGNIPYDGWFAVATFPTGGTTARLEEESSPWGGPVRN